MKVESLIYYLVCFAGSFSGYSLFRHLRVNEPGLALAVGNLGPVCVRGGTFHARYNGWVLNSWVGWDLVSEYVGHLVWVPCVGALVVEHPHVRLEL